MRAWVVALIATLVLIVAGVLSGSLWLCWLAIAFGLAALGLRALDV